MRKAFVSLSTKIQWLWRRRLKVFANSRPISLNSNKSLRPRFNRFPRCCEKGRRYRRPFFFRIGLIMEDPFDSQNPELQTGGCHKPEVRFVSTASLGIFHFTFPYDSDPPVTRLLHWSSLLRRLCLL